MYTDPPDSKGRTEDHSGRWLGERYVLEEPIGQGGMAVVWRAVKHGAAGFERPVAIKRILPHLSDDPHFVEMFVEEARVASTLTHPNICQIYDFGRDPEGRHFLVMEYVQGVNLEQFIHAHTRASRTTPWHLVAAIGIEVLRALAAAHSRVDANQQRQPVLHRDVTPGNVLLSLDGAVKLADFGLARALDRPTMTPAHVVKGKVAYLAPEMAHGAPPTPQTDIHTVGVLLWEALAGRRLHDADSEIETLRLVRASKVPPISELRPELPSQLSAAIHKALETKPERRFRSALEMLRALAKVLRRVPDLTDGPMLRQSILKVHKWQREFPEQLPLQRDPEVRRVSQSALEEDVIAATVRAATIPPFALPSESGPPPEKSTWSKAKRISSFDIEEAIENASISEHPASSTTPPRPPPTSNPPEVAPASAKPPGSLSDSSVRRETTQTVRVGERAKSSPRNRRTTPPPLPKRESADAIPLRRRKPSGTGG